MFDIGFAELIVIAIVGLLVIGPERLPGAIRTGAVWLNRLRRSFNDIKREVQQELHNDAVMQDLKATGEQIKEEAQGLTQNLSGEINKTIPPLGADRTADRTEEKAEGKAEDTAENEAPRDKIGGA